MKSTTYAGLFGLIGFMTICAIFYMFGRIDMQDRVDHWQAKYDRLAAKTDFVNIIDAEREVADATRRK